MRDLEIREGPLKNRLETKDINRRHDNGYKV